MNPVEYQAMSNQELKKYFLEHREDQNALQEYLARRHQNSKSIITTAEDREFDEKIQAAIFQQINKKS
jgi:hypothetical protein